MMNDEVQRHPSLSEVASSINTRDAQVEASHNLQDSFDELTVYVKAIRDIVDSDDFQFALRRYDSLPEVNKTKLRNRFYEFHGYYGKGFFDLIKQLRHVK